MELARLLRRTAVLPRTFGVWDLEHLRREYDFITMPDFLKLAHPLRLTAANVTCFSRTGTKQWARLQKSLGLKGPCGHTMTEPRQSPGLNQHWFSAFDHYSQAANQAVLLSGVLFDWPINLAPFYRHLRPERSVRTATDKFLQENALTRYLGVHVRSMGGKACTKWASNANVKQQLGPNVVSKLGDRCHITGTFVRELIDKYRNMGVTLDTKFFVSSDRFDKHMIEDLKSAGGLLFEPSSATADWWILANSAVVVTNPASTFSRAACASAVQRHQGLCDPPGAMYMRHPI